MKAIAIILAIYLTAISCQDTSVEDQCIEQQFTKVADELATTCPDVDFLSGTVRLHFF